jgi:asparagine synthase (glutamine-hydrolysing)
MCGIAGFVNLFPGAGAEELRATVAAMATTLVHRGPDDAGVWVDPAAGVALGFRRLAILDLSPGGHQPMASASGRYVIVFNGEVYNFAELRQELEATGVAPVFRGRSDTEVILAAVEAWGLEPAVQRFVGMFAFALWDRAERRLHLVRDRLGVKPLYYGRCCGAYLFASELKALRPFPGFQPEVDRDALALLLRHNYIPGPHTIWKGVSRLVPGSILTLTAEGPAAPVPYWSARALAEAGAADPFRGTEAEAVERLDALLRDAVRLRLVADVPLGVFLSGGVDSSVVTALMQAQSSRPVKTFTIGFHEGGYDEAGYAREVARHLGTEHTELYVTAAEARDVIPRLPALYDEPFSDPSQIPTYLVAALARRHVTVALSGDGGDELFAGYNRYALGRRLWRSVGWMPRRMRAAAARALTLLSPAAWDAVLGPVRPVLPAPARVGNPGDRIAKLAGVLVADGPDELYRRLISHWKEPAALVPGSTEPPTALTDRRQWARLPEFTQRMAYLDLVTYLPDDILVKVDRASMGVSLEAREPLLDHRLVEFAWRLPTSLKVRRGRGKWVLRQVLFRYVPPRLIERPKTGFGIPLEAWLRGPLRDWAEALLDERRLKTEGFFDPAPVRAKWQEHLAGRRNWHYYLWSILMFQAWREHWGG